MKSETKLGIFTILGLVLFGFSLYFLGGFSVTRTYNLNIKFADVSGLPIKAPVKLAGVEVGKVKKIKIEGEDVIVVAEIQDGVKIREGAQFSVVMTGIIGSKYLKVIQGIPGAPTFQPDAYIDGINDIPMDVMITQTMSSVKEFVDSVSNNGMMGAQLNQTMNELRQLSTNLNQMIAAMRPYLTSSVQNLDAATEKLAALLTSIDNGEGVIGSLVKDPDMKTEVKETVADLRSTMAEVKTVVGKMGKFQVYWDYDFFYMPDPKLSTSDLGVDIYTPSGYTFYHVGMANLGNEDNTPDKRDYLEKNKLDVRLGLYNKWAKFSAGMIRGAGGVALELRPFHDQEFLDRFTFTGEFTDWGRDRTINGRHFDKPNVSYGVDFRFNKYFSVGAWARDALETNNFAIRANVAFNDQDISSFFGLAAVAGTK